MTPNWLIATSLVVKSGNERLGMVQHVPGINANGELLGFGDPERLLHVGVEGPESEPCQGVGRQDPVFSGFGIHQHIHGRNFIRVSRIQKKRPLCSDGNPLGQSTQNTAIRVPGKSKAFTVGLDDLGGIVALRIDYSGVGADDTWSIHARIRGFQAWLVTSPPWPRRGVFLPLRMKEFISRGPMYSFCS